MFPAASLAVTAPKNNLKGGQPPFFFGLWVTHFTRRVGGKMCNTSNSSASGRIKTNKGK